MNLQRIYAIRFADVYPLYVAKVTKKGRSEAELVQVISWLTGYSEEELAVLAVSDQTFEQFFDAAPQLNPNRTKITGVICGVRVEEIKEPLMQNIRYLDKVVDELAKARPIQKILRA